MKLLRTNNLYFGILMGLLAPVVGYLIVSPLNEFLQNTFNDGYTILREDTIRMIAIFLNPIVYISYLKKKEYEMTGRGVLLVTFIGVIYIFIITFL